jgi:AAA domain
VSDLRRDPVGFYAALRDRGCLLDDESALCPCPEHNGEPPPLEVSWREGQVVAECPEHDLDQICDALAAFDADRFYDHLDEDQLPVRIVTVEEFAAVEEPGAEPIVGTANDAVIPTNGDVMVYGDGGASKTTLSIDLAMHLAAGEEWLDIPVPRPVRVLLIEAEGPRPLFRAKLRRKLAGWEGSDVGDRLQVIERPWARFRFPDDREVAELIGEHEIDVLVVGPLSRVGWEDLGTLQEVRKFMETVAEFRRRSGRSLTVVLIHHENKGGKVSGAFEGAGDTLLHTEVRARGRTKLTFQKVRWSSEWHRQALDLGWTDGEGFEVIEEDRDLVAEIRVWLTLNPYSTAKEIATKKRNKRADDTVEQIPGIQANETVVRDLLEARQDLFRSRTKEGAAEVGRHPTAVVWEVR